MVKDQNVEDEGEIDDYDDDSSGDEPDDHELETFMSLLSILDDDVQVNTSEQ